MNNSWDMIIVRRVPYRVWNHHCHDFCLFFRVDLWYFFYLFINFFSANFFRWFFAQLFSMIFDFSFCGMFSSSRFSTLDMRFGMVRTVAKTGPSVDLTPNYSRWVLLFVLTLFSRIEVLSINLTSQVSLGQLGQS